MFRGILVVFLRFVDDFVVVVGGSVDDVFVVLVIVFFGFVDCEVIVVVVGVVFGNILLVVFVGVRFDDLDVLVVIICIGVRVEDLDNDVFIFVVGEVFVIEVFVDSSDGFGFSGRSVSDGGSDDRFGCDSGGYGRVIERNVNGEKDVVGNGLMMLEDVIIIVEFRVIIRVFNVILVKGYMVGVGVVNGVIVVVVVVIDIEE